MSNKYQVILRFFNYDIPLRIFDTRDEADCYSLSPTDKTLEQDSYRATSIVNAIWTEFEVPAVYMYELGDGGRIESMTFIRDCQLPRRY